MRNSIKILIYLVISGTVYMTALPWIKAFLVGMRVPIDFWHLAAYILILPAFAAINYIRKNGIMQFKQKHMFGVLFWTLSVAVTWIGMKYSDSIYSFGYYHWWVGLLPWVWIIATMGFATKGGKDSGDYNYESSKEREESLLSRYSENAQNHNDDRAVSSRTEVSYNILDGIIDSVNDTDSYGEQHVCTITTEKGIEIKGYGMSAEDAKSDAEKNYDHYLRTGF